VADLKYPDKARKEFEKGMESLDRKEMSKAKEHF